MPHTTHANARPTPAGRLAPARCVVEPFVSAAR